MHANWGAHARGSTSQRGGDSIGFAATASRAPMVAYERKICEMCGAMFTRQVPMRADLGEKYCPRHRPREQQSVPAASCKC